ncbi:RidA family protein [Candidatus Uabimicrobium amorphum]|uniref:Reactive intermediate/imine deaminase n=1 Tax=Uabimicrobium amorphum TaxID=2596890 RepID=A0A5S9F325_UABAM|nr:RidA family protein [Candidatus Uabimicrobium amorphum]BBM84062.1 reactive intermediate/imine deaminase [Candidatus Uabimicrobium amorphum]
MEKKIVFSENAPKPIGPYSQAVRVGELMFLSGQIALDPQSGELKNASFAEECTTVLENLKAVLEAGGSSMTNLVKVNVFLKDLGNFVEFNGIYEKYVQESKPARACVEVSRLPKDVNIEIEAVALCKE